MVDSSALGKVYGYNSESVDTDQGYKDLGKNAYQPRMPFAQCSLRRITPISHNMYLIPLLHLSETHPRCKAILENNGFRVPKSSVLK